MHVRLSYPCRAVWLATVLAGFSVVHCLAAPQVIVEAPQPFPAGEAFAPDDPDNRLPKLIGSIEVTYPAELLAAPVADRVYVALVVDRDGKPQKVRAFFGQYPELEQVAVAAVERAAFSPGRHGGQDVNTQMVVAVHFVVDS